MKFVLLDNTHLKRKRSHKSTRLLNCTAMHIIYYRLYSSFYNSVFYRFWLLQFRVLLQVPAFTIPCFTDSGFYNSGFYRRRLLQFRVLQIPAFTIPCFTDSGFYNSGFYRFRLLQFRVLQIPAFTIPGFTDSGFYNSGFSYSSFHSTFHSLILYSGFYR